MLLSNEQRLSCVRSLASALVRLRSFELSSVRNVRTELHVGQYIIFQSMLTVLNPLHVQLKVTIKNKRNYERDRMSLKDILPSDCIMAIQSFARMDFEHPRSIWTFRNRSIVQDCLRFIHPAMSLADENPKTTPFHGKVNVLMLRQMGANARTYVTAKSPVRRNAQTYRKLWGAPSPHKKTKK